MHLWPRCIEKKTEKNTFYLKSKKNIIQKLTEQLVMTLWTKQTPKE